jgi:hypothetical protein
MLADGMQPAAVARRLGVDVRSLNGLLDSPLVADLSQREHLDLVRRGAWVQYQRMRTLAERHQRAVPDDLNGSARSNIGLPASSFGDSARHFQLAADRHLRTYLDAVRAIAELGGGDGAEVRNLHLSVDANERGDLPSTAGEVLDDDDGDDD